MLASDLAKQGEKVIGWRILTCAIGKWPGGPAEIIDLGDDPNAPEIVMNVLNDKGKSIGVFDHEDVLVLKAYDPRQFEREGCNNCHYLGRYAKYDLYYHHSRAETTFIARYGDGPDYYSSVYMALDFGSEYEPGLAIREAIKRAAAIATFRRQIIRRFKRWERGEFPERWKRLKEIIDGVQVEE